MARDWYKDSSAETVEHDDRIPRGVNHGSAAGLASVPKGTAFRCTDCMYIRNGVCKNRDPRIHDQPVDETMCCNYFNNRKMRVIVS